MITEPTMASQMASRFATRRPDFEQEQAEAFADWLVARDGGWWDDATKHQRRWETVTARWEQWEHTHKAAA